MQCSFSKYHGSGNDFIVIDDRFHFFPVKDKVSNGEIDYTIADEQTALISKSYNEDLDIDVEISFPQKIAWVVKRNSPELLRYINEWIAKNQTTIKEIQDKYYYNPKKLEEEKINLKSKNNFKLSEFDNIIKEQASTLNWDWRLLASLIYQESRFNPNAKSWVGARGLMQLMPATAKNLGLSLEQMNNPKLNISAGVKHLKWLNEYWKNIITDDDERIKFILASYNSGQGHVNDAIILTRINKRNPLKWNENVAESMLLLSDPDYYNGYGVRYGYCRGIETYKYVKEILERYQYYQKSIRN